MRMTGGEAIVGELVRHGIDTVFGLPGAQIYGLFDAFHQASMRVVGARHEQACSYMALGAALATGRPGIFAVVPGPGILNAAAGMVTGLGRAPLLCLTGEVPSDFWHVGRGHLHELPDQLQTLRTLTKWADHIANPAEAPRKVAEAFVTMASGRPGPVALEMCWDQFTATQDVELLDPLSLPEPPQPDPDRVAEAARLIAAARAPMIMVGGGAFGAAAEITALAARLGAPVMANRSGRGIVGDDDPLAVTSASAYLLWPQTDLVIGIGTRLEVPGWRWPTHPEAPKIVRIEIDETEVGRFPVDAPILADAAAGTAALLAAVESSGQLPADRTAEIARAKAETAEAIQRVQPQMSYLGAIRDVLPADGIIVDELSQIGFASWFGFPVYRPRTFISSGYQGTLGAGFPMALGVKVARPEVPVVSIAGDGGFMFGVQELATAVQYGIGVTVIVFNNSSYGNVRRDQMTSFGGRVLGSDLVNPDFLGLAEAFGLSGHRVRSPDELRPVLEGAFREDKPCLIEVPLERGSETSPWEFIHPAPFE